MSHSNSLFSSLPALVTRINVITERKCCSNLLDSKALLIVMTQSLTVDFTTFVSFDTLKWFRLAIDTVEVDSQLP